MKKVYTLFFAVLVSVGGIAQTPQKMSYQAVIRNSGGVLVANTQVGMEIKIRQGSESGTIVYTETQTPTTNANGLVSIEIGGGAGFSSISWATNSYFIETNTAIVAPLTTYTITGVSKLLSVPYSLHAKTVEGTSGTNTGDNATNTQYSGLLTNATHTGDATGSGVLTLATVNSDVGTFNNITINAKGLATAGSNVSYLLSEADPTVKAITGIVKSNGTTISAATAGTDYLTPTGSAATLTGFPTLNQNTTGSAASFTGSLSGEVTGIQGATVIGNSAVLGKVLTDYVSGAGTVAATDNILQAIQKLNGNDATNANLTGMVTSVGNTTTVVTNANLTGDVTSVGNEATIANNAVTNAKLATVETATIKGRVTAATGNVEDLTATQVRTLLNVADGATNYTHPTGDGNFHVPATSTTNNGKVLTAGATAGSLSWETPTTGGSSLAIGDSYGGGIIFWLDASGQHGLIAATADQSTGVIWTPPAFQTTASSAMLGRNGIKGGLMNTERIIIQVGENYIDYAAQLCANYTGGYYCDWYLPSSIELNMMYFHIGQGNLFGLGNVGGFANGFYWSSFEANSNLALNQDFTDGSGGLYTKDFLGYVRAVRAF